MVQDYQMPRIALDMESVLADTHEVYIRALNSRHGTSYRYEDVDDWDWVQQGERDFEEFMEIVETAWKKRWRTMPSCEREEIQYETVAELSHQFEVDIVTARTGVEEEMKQWLDKKTILRNINDFRSLDPSNSKADLNYGIYVDDNPNLAENIDDEQLLFLFDQPWNQEVEPRDNIVRVDSLSQVLFHFDP